MSTCLINSHLGTGNIEFERWNQGPLRDLGKDQYTSTCNIFTDVKTLQVSVDLDCVKGRAAWPKG